jgi:DNA-binding transcriptional MerR regulator
MVDTMCYNANMMNLLNKEDFLKEAKKQGVNITYRALRKYIAEGIFPQPIKGKRYLGLYEKGWIEELKLIREALEKYHMKIKDIRNFKASGLRLKEYVSKSKLHHLINSTGSGIYEKLSNNLNSEDRALLRAEANFNLHLNFLQEFMKGNVKQFNLPRKRLLVLLKTLKKGVEILEKKKNEAKQQMDIYENIVNVFSKQQKSYGWLIDKYSKIFSKD